MKRYYLIAGVSMIVLSGCGAAKYQNKLLESNVTKPPSTEVVRKEIIYKENPKIKKAVSILIKKVEKIESGEKINSNSDDDRRLSDIENRLKKLEQKETKLPKAQKCESTPFYRIERGRYVALKDVFIRACPDYNSIILGKIKKGTIVELVGCNNYGWCRLKDKKGYVAGFLFKKVAVSKKAPSAKAVNSGKYVEDRYEKIIKDYLKEDK